MDDFDWSSLGDFLDGSSYVDFGLDDIDLGAGMDFGGSGGSYLPDLTASGGGGSWLDAFEKGGTLDKFLSSGAFKAGASGLGGLLSYIDSKKGRDAYAQYQQYQRGQQADINARRAKYDDPVKYKSLMTAVAQPKMSGGRDEALFFKNNTLGGSGLKKLAEGGLARYLDGDSSGQSDKVPSLLSDGEYVLDADIVAALGDGNTKAGVAALDEMRENIRRHKRSVSANKIPPKAKNPEQYMKRGK